LSRLLVWAIVISSLGLGSTPPAEPIQQVCLAQLVAQPKEYKGKSIRVAGYLELQVEGDSLFSSLEDIKRGRWDQAVWIELDHNLWRQRKKLTNNAVQLVGIFDSGRFGNNGYYAGTITHVDQATVLEPAEYSRIQAKCNSSANQ
jgi:hypothetical protein